jgi:hypothetical protein
MPRWLTFLLALTFGISLGLLYGWVIDPIEYVDTTPDTLRPDFKADYVLMTAESFHADQDVELAARRLALLGSQPPGDLARQGLEDARSLGFAESDLLLMQKLTTAMQAWQPAEQESAP